jgi:hypothetical protein
MSVRDLKLDATGDLDITGGGALVADEEAIAQEIKVRVHTFSSEYFLDTTRGIPWLNWNDRKWSASAIREAQILLRAELLEVPGVKSVRAPGVVITKSGTSVSISATVVTDLGELLPVQETI